jgi:hypothetical protein
LKKQGDSFYAFRIRKRRISMAWEEAFFGELKGYSFTATVMDCFQLIP